MSLFINKSHSFHVLGNNIACGMITLLLSHLKCRMSYVMCHMEWDRRSKEICDWQSSSNTRCTILCIHVYMHIHIHIYIFLCSKAHNKILHFNSFTFHSTLPSTPPPPPPPPPSPSSLSFFVLVKVSLPACTLKLIP